MLKSNYKVLHSLNSACVGACALTGFAVFSSFLGLPPESSILRLSSGVLRGFHVPGISPIWPFTSRRAGDTRTRDFTAGLIGVK